MSKSPKSLFKPVGWRDAAPRPQRPTVDGPSPLIIEHAPEPQVQVPPFPAVPVINDGRALAGLEAREEKEQLQDRTREVLRTANVPLDDTSFDLLISNIRRANSKYEAAFEALLDTGLTLLAIQKSVGPGGYKALIEARIVQIGETNASKLRQIARAVESGKIPPLLLPSMPRNLSGAYVIATLPSDVIEPTMLALIDRGMLPECNYRKLEQEIRNLRDLSGQAFDLHRSLHRKRAALERLKSEIADLETRIRNADATTQVPAGEGRGVLFADGQEGGASGS